MIGDYLSSLCFLLCLIVALVRSVVLRLIVASVQADLCSVRLLC